MRHIDVFNGDADGICALLQIRLANPVESELVTGVKRDIRLLERVEAGTGDRVTVLDVAMEKNRHALDRLLAAGATVFYADHHFAGEIPDHPRLEAFIDPAPDVCTSLIVNDYLGGVFTRWALVGTYGDNLIASAELLADKIALDEDERGLLRNLGTCINYNGYGTSVEDLHFSPTQLFQRLRTYADPLQFIADDAETLARLESGYQQDMAAAEAVPPSLDSPHAAVFVLPSAAWARRAGGVFGNALANRYPHRAHAVITERTDGGYLISVRAPLSNKTGADEVCRAFPTGGGRKAAAGVNNLPADRLAAFIGAFSDFYQRLFRG